MGYCQFRKIPLYSALFSSRAGVNFQFVEEEHEPGGPRMVLFRPGLPLSVAIVQSDLTWVRFGAGIFSLLVVGGVLLLYFLPSFLGRQKGNFKAIFALNLLLGWTLVGWVVSLVWALSQETAVPAQRVPTEPPSRLCSKCGRYSAGSAYFCGNCGAVL
jgi:hypothetical protein